MRCNMNVLSWGVLKLSSRFQNFPHYPGIPHSPKNVFLKGVEKISYTVLTQRKKM